MCNNPFYSHFFFRIGKFIFVYPRSKLLQVIAFNEIKSSIRMQSYYRLRYYIIFVVLSVGNIAPEMGGIYKSIPIIIAFPKPSIFDVTLKRAVGLNIIYVVSVF